MFKRGLVSLKNSGSFVSNVRLFVTTSSVASEGLFEYKVMPTAQPTPLKRTKNRSSRKTKKREQPYDMVSGENISFFELSKVLAKTNLSLSDIENDQEAMDIFKYRREAPSVSLETEITHQSYNGDGLGLVNHEGKMKVVCVQKTYVGDYVKFELGRHEKYLVEGELTEVIRPSKNRRNNLVTCEYFEKCRGCDFHMVPYEEQLTYKQRTIEKAFEMCFQEKTRLLIPPIEDTIESPLQLGYRTKLTPHFNISKHREQVPNIGFEMGGRSVGQVLDIPKCVIATPVVNEGLERERERIHKNLHLYKKGATCNIRESLEMDDGEEKKVSVEDPKATITEKIHDKIFKFGASTFFQNNSSILPIVIDYLKANLNYTNSKGVVENPKYLVDTYCGSGFFGISLSDEVEKVIGIEISKPSIESAIKNAKLNNLANCEFLTGESESLFQSKQFSKILANGDESVVVMDPSKKGSNYSFLKQLSDFKPRKIIYISCNVFTQARDLKMFLDMNNDYTVQNIRGFDFFPQTKNVESIAILEYSGNETPKRFIFDGEF